MWRSGGAMRRRGRNKPRSAAGASIADMLLLIAVCMAVCGGAGFSAATTPSSGAAAVQGGADVRERVSLSSASWNGPDGGLGGALSRSQEGVASPSSFSPSSLTSSLFSTSVRTAGTETNSRSADGGLPAANTNPDVVEGVPSSFVETYAAAGHDGYRSGYVCQSCVDAMNAVRSQFSCVGNVPVAVPGSDRTSDIAVCPFVGSCAGYDDPEDQAMCRSIEELISSNALFAYDTYEHLRAGYSPYDQCAKLGKCESRLTEGGRACASHFEDPLCSAGPGCSQSPYECESVECSICYWVLNTWPRWTGECIPANPSASSTSSKSSASKTSSKTKSTARGRSSFRFRQTSGTSGASVGGMTAKEERIRRATESLDAAIHGLESAGAALLGTQSSVGEHGRLRQQHHRGSHRLLRRAARYPFEPHQSSSPLGGDLRFAGAHAGDQVQATPAPAFVFEKAGYKSDPLEAAKDEDPRDASTLSRTCSDMYEFVRTNPLARLYAQVSATLGPYPWDAELACMCLGRCPYDSIEAFGIHAACHLPVSVESASTWLFPELFRPSPSPEPRKRPKLPVSSHSPSPRPNPHEPPKPPSTSPSPSPSPSRAP